MDNNTLKTCTFYASKVNRYGKDGWKLDQAHIINLSKYLRLPNKSSLNEAPRKWLAEATSLRMSWGSMRWQRGIKTFYSNYLCYCHSFKRHGSGKYFTTKTISTSYTLYILLFLSANNPLICSTSILL